MGMHDETLLQTVFGTNHKRTTHMKDCICIDCFELMCLRHIFLFVGRNSWRFMAAILYGYSK